MRNLDIIAEELFNKIRGRFPSVTIGNDKGEVTNVPKEARYFDFDFKEGERSLGKVSVSVGNDTLAIMYSNDFVTQEDTLTKNAWYDFLKEIRVFAKKRMLNFDTRDINKSNLDKRDYQFLAANRPGDITMESTMYGTSKTSYQNIGGARLAIKHSSPINQERAAGRTQNVSAIYIESAEGERFKYPFKHLNGARAMARHVAEGGMPFDDFGTHIVGLSEELAKLKKFKSYMGRSAVMAESLAGYNDIVNDRIKNVKKTIENIQKESHYKKISEEFVKPVLEDVPSDVAENWIDQLTIKQFNEELKDVFPYIYNLVGEATKAKGLDFANLLDEGAETMVCKDCGDEMHKPTTDCEHDCDDENGSNWKAKVKEGEQPADSYVVKPGDTIWAIADRFADSNYDGDVKAGTKDIMDLNDITDPESLQPGQKLIIGYFMGGMSGGGSRGLPPTGFKSYDEELDAEFERTMGQFSDVPEKPQVPITEFILSMYDREVGAFPKGETAVLTAIEKDYGEKFIEPSKNFIERMHTTFAEHNQTQKDPELAPFEDKLAERNKTKIIDPVSGAELDPEKPEDLMYHDDDEEDIEESGKNKTSEEVNRIKHLSGI